MDALSDQKKIAHVTNSYRLQRLNIHCANVRYRYQLNKCKELKETTTKLLQRRKELLLNKKLLIAKDTREEKDHLIFLNLQMSLIHGTESIKNQIQSKAQMLNERKIDHANTIKHYQVKLSQAQKEYKSLPEVKRAEEIKASIAKQNELEEKNAELKKICEVGWNVVMSVDNDLKKAMVQFAEAMLKHEKNRHRILEQRRMLVQKIDNLTSLITIEKNKRQASVGNYIMDVNLSEFDFTENYKEQALSLEVDEPQYHTEEYDMPSVLSLDMSFDQSLVIGGTDSIPFRSYDAIQTSTPYGVHPTQDGTPEQEQQLEPTVEPPIDHVVDQPIENVVDQPIETVVSDSAVGLESSNMGFEESREFDNRRYEKSPETLTGFDVSDEFQNRRYEKSPETLTGCDGQSDYLTPMSASKPLTMESQSSQNLQPTSNAPPGFQFQNTPANQQPSVVQPQPSTMPFFCGILKPSNETNAQETPKPFGFFNFGSSQNQPSSSIFNLFG